jgi:mRNA interferase HigB
MRCRFFFRGLRRTCRPKRSKSVGRSSQLLGREVRVALDHRLAEARRARWKRPADVKANRRNVSIIANNRVVFNIKGNDYRLVVAMRYDKQIMFVRFIGTHAEYDRIDATTV